ncbi:hypothetical protein HF1_01630 [Mycoplasma haemofelis str. Langford 1]|uniref:Uncharacterized protein n=2 Tax=Mycoplasma haemofelis TaxID=29501 RepID=F6FG17_MYCHI|nr:hypothetical protein [Mycoplasma haemofelis]AEG72483.1 hypothetical protein MHF_0184 [Mycoplasma haemofelis Ohio2]CBY92171.1 hypothetical protein HF1_01630 [Mycoplasma haemofelis str. Langford 1]
MTASFKAAAGILGALGTGTAGAGGLYYGTNVSIDHEIGHEFLGNEEEFNDSWKQKHEQLLTAQEDSLTSDLQGIRRTHNTKPSETGAKALREWCNSMRNSSYKNIFKSENKQLLGLTKKYCIQSLKDKMASDKLPTLTGNTDQETFKTNYKKLKSHQDQQGKLDSELLELKSSFNEGQAETKWTSIQSWCSRALEKAFKGSKDNLFLLTETFCKKA